jgi:tripartite-type tricarboxylate transporter receptor subunit TctC
MRRYKNMETSMNRRIVLQAAGLAAAALLGAGPALAQGFPARSITLVVPNPPGGVVDTAARLASDPLSRLLGQSVVVDNRGGASGNIAYQMVARAPKDGYTLLASYSAYHVGNPALFPRLPWAQSELAPVGLIVAATNVIAVHPSVPANNLQEFIAYLRKNPGKVNYASINHHSQRPWKKTSGRLVSPIHHDRTHTVRLRGYHPLRHPFPRASPTRALFTVC